MRAQERVELPVLAACLMPNHVHLVVHPRLADDIPRWMQWLFTTHVRHYHEKYGTTGMTLAGSLQGIPRSGRSLSADAHPLRRAQRAAREAGRAGGRLALGEPALAMCAIDHRLRLEPPPMPLPANWTEFVNQPQTAAELEAIRTSVNRQRPFGDPELGQTKGPRCGPRAVTVRTWADHENAGAAPFARKWGVPIPITRA